MGEGVGLMETVYQHLKLLGCDVRCTKTLRPGSGFNQQIRTEIARAHLFIPLVSKTANERGWVHQEICYALAMNVPILPLAVGELPQGMVEGLQALALNPMDPVELSTKLTPELISNHVRLHSASDFAMYERAEFHEDRTRMLVDAAGQALQEVCWDQSQAKRPCDAFRVRQMGALSSFSLPDKPYYDQQWQTCNGNGHPRSMALCRDLQHERQRLEQLALVGGCDLVVSPRIRYTERGTDALIARLHVLIDFLNRAALRLPHFRIVIAEDVLPGNLLILGDWFLAESVTPEGSLGYVQTLATWHAPTVLRRQQEFDHIFDRLLEQFQEKSQGMDLREAAIQKLQEFVSELRAGTDARSVD